MFRLALDAGHGIHTAGRRIPAALDLESHREWWLNDRVCRMIQEAAKRYQDFEILRVDDVTGQEDVPMSVRCRRANDWGADLYYSAHHNAGINGGRGGGLVAFSLSEGTRAAEWRNALYDAIAAATGLVGNRARPKTTGNLYVLRNTESPAVLVEHGFMDSPEDVPVILPESYAKAVGQAVADCIAQRAGLTKINPEEESEMTREEVVLVAKEAAVAAVTEAVEKAVKEATEAAVLTAVKEALEAAVPVAVREATETAVKGAVTEALGPHYIQLKDVTKPSYLAVLEKLIEKGYLRGREGTGGDMVIDLYESDVRSLVVIGRVLEAAGAL